MEERGKKGIEGEKKEGWFFSVCHLGNFLCGIHLLVSFKYLFLLFMDLVSLFDKLISQRTNHLEKPTSPAKKFRKVPFYRRFRKRNRFQRAVALFSVRSLSHYNSFIQLFLVQLNLM